MLIDEVSDFHVEMWGKTPDWAEIKNPGSQVLVIAGDTSNSIFRSAEVIDEAARYYEHVVFVDGNHEHYGNGRHYDVVAAMDWFTAVTAPASRKNVVYLRGNNSFLLDDVLFVGACGWYDFTIMVGYSREQQHEAWKNGSNDKKCIRFSEGFYPDKMAALQAEQIARVVTEAQDREEVREIVVVTHTSPLLRGLRITGNPGWDAMNGAYGNSLMGQVFEADKNQKIKLWFYGHTHYNNDFDHGHVRVISAPRGYQGERLPWERPLQVDTSGTHGSAFGELDAA